MNIPLEVEIAKDVVGALGFLGGIGYALFRIGKAISTFELVGAQQAKEITSINVKIDKLIDQTARIDRLDERMLAQGKRLDEIVVRFNHAHDTNLGTP